MERQILCTDKYRKFANNVFPRKDFQAGTCEFKGIESSMTHITYSALAAFEYFEHIDSVDIVMEIQLIAYMLDRLLFLSEPYLRFVQNNGDKIYAYKCGYRMSVEGVIDSILTWSCTSTCGLLMQPLLQRLLSDKTNDILYLSEAQERSTGNIIHQNINTTSGYFEGTQAEKYAAINGFEMGFAMKPQMVTHEWMVFQGFLVYFRRELFEDTVSFKWHLGNYMKQWRAWRQFWLDMAVIAKNSAEESQWRASFND